MGYGFHAGVRYDPGAPVSFSAGVKFFPYKWLYINAQFATKWIEHIDEYLIGWEYIGWTRFPITADVDNSYFGYGTAFMVGGDWVWGKKIAYGFNVGLGILYIINAKTKHSVSWSYGDVSTDVESIRPALDLGFIIRF